MKHIFIVNPAAGAADATEYVRKSVLESGIDDYEIYTTKNSGDATNYIKSYLDTHKEECRFYSCGGDGTLNEVVNGVVGYDNASVTVFPCGSGNDFIKYYGSHKDFSDIKELCEGINQKIDVLKVCGKYAINAVHFGLDTVVLNTMIKVRRTPTIGGKNAYSTGVVTALIKGMKTACRIVADGKQIGKDKLLLCTLSNGRYVGGSYKCAPKSLNDDGLIEVCHVNPLSRFTFLKLMNIYKRGEHLDNPKFEPYINYTKAKKIEIFGGDGFFISVDGELVDVKNCIVEVMEKAINFAVPKKLLKQKEFALN